VLHTAFSRLSSLEVALFIPASYIGAAG